MFKTIKLSCHGCGKVIKLSAPTLDELQDELTRSGWNEEWKKIGHPLGIIAQAVVINTLTK